MWCSWARKRNAPTNARPSRRATCRGEEEREQVYVHPEGFYEERGIELRTSTRAVGLDPASSEVVLADGERLPYHRLLLTTGASPRRLSVPGADLPGIRYLRAVEDSDGLRDAIRAASRVVVVGAGWIGAEVAASARQMGADVALVEMAAVPLERVMGPEVGAVYRDLHSDHGVELHMETGVEAFVGDDAAEGVRTPDGSVIPGDLVVVGVGVAPRVELAEAAGLEVENGIVVNEYLETSAPGVYAAGDVANARHPLFAHRLRAEHWANALHQGPAAARNMLGEDTPYDRVPYFFSDQYDLGMEYSGFAVEWDRVVFRGDPKRREFIAFWLDVDGRGLAGMNANVWEVTDTIQALVRSRRPVDAERLADLDVRLDDLIPSAI